MMLLAWLTFGRQPPPPPRPEPDWRQDFYEAMRVAQATGIVAALTYQIKPTDMAAYRFEVFVLNHLVPEGVIWC